MEFRFGEQTIESRPRILGVFRWQLALPLTSSPLNKATKARCVPHVVDARFSKCLLCLFVLPRCCLQRLSLARVGLNVCSLVCW